MEGKCSYHFGSSIKLLEFFGIWDVTMPFKQIFLHVVCCINVTKMVAIGQKNIVSLSLFLYWLVLCRYSFSLSATCVTDCLTELYHVAFCGGHKNVS